ncbi:cell wall-binding repeat-containing protein [Kineococcus gynurae]|uniref:Cell wall-binding repeat-containing protein n=1 Tax=Kineococcus gynurae TaxID=452979 RepID=A0ABV5LQ40_9ACTN
MTAATSRLRRRGIGAGVAALVGLTGLGTVVPAQALPNFEVARPSSTENRFATAASINTDYFTSGASNVIVVNGDNPVDALAASFLAGTTIPILYVKRDSVPEETAAALEDLNPSTVWVVGGTNAISDAVYDEVGGDERVQGSDRYETALEVAQTKLNGATPNTVYLVTGTDLADALAIAPVAARSGIPVLLTKPNELPDSVVDALSTWGTGTRVFIIGGENAVSADIESDISAAGHAVTRVRGDNRRDTSVQIANGNSFSKAGVWLVNGNRPVDALPAAIVAAAQNYPIVFTADGSLGEEAEGYLSANYSTLTTAIAAGGTSVLPESVVEAADEAASTVTTAAAISVPAFTYAQAGQTVALSSTVTGAIPSGSTVAPPVRNAGVTFEVLNSGGAVVRTLTATTNSDGVASVNFSTGATGSYTYRAFVTATPEVATQTAGSLQVGVAATPIAVTAAGGSSVGVNTARTYTVTLQDPATGAPYTTATTLKVSLANLLDTDATNNSVADVRFNGSGSAPTVTGSSIGTVTVPANTASATFTLSSTSGATVTPTVWLDSDSDNAIDANEFRAQGPATTFVARQYTFTAAPVSGTASIGNGGQRVYSGRVVDQYGTPYTGSVEIGLNELQDNNSSTTTSAVLLWTSATATPVTTPGAGTATPTGATAVNGTTGAATVSVTPNASGNFSFAVYSAAATTATPTIWVESGTPNAIRESNEQQFTSTATTWVAPVLTGATLAAPDDQVLTTSSAAGTSGSEVFTFTTVDQSGNAINVAANTPVTYTVRNTGANPVVISGATAASGSSLTLAAGATGTYTDTIASGANNETITLTAADATSATVSAAATVNGVNLSGSDSATFLKVNGAESGTAAETFSGTVLWVTKNTATPSASYLLQTSVGNVLLTIGASGSTGTVNGSTATAAQLVDAISVGDSVVYTDTTSGSATTGKNHAITNG